MKVLTNVDLNKNQILNAVVQKLATPPSNPIEGQKYYDTTQHREFTYNGTKWVGNDASDAEMSGAEVVSAINGSDSKIDNDNLSSSVNTAVANSHTHSNKAVLDASTASYTTAEKTKLSHIAATQSVDLDKVKSDTAKNNAKVSNVSHTGDVTGSEALTISNNAVTNAKLADMPSQTIKGRVSGSKGDAEDLTIAQAKDMLGLVIDQSKMDGAGFALQGGGKMLTVEGHIDIMGSGHLDIGSGGTLGSGAFAPKYVHPTGDGNSHVPATGTSNNGKVLTAGSTAGSLSWTNPSVNWNNVSGKPSSSAGDIDNAVSKKHTHSNKNLLDSYTYTNGDIGLTFSKRHQQNTDTGTNNLSFEIGGNDLTNGMILRAGSGTLRVESEKNAGLGDIEVLNAKIDGNLTVAGTTTVINSTEVDIGDNEILLNSDVADSSQNSSGGIAIKRVMSNGKRADAKLEFNESTGKWYTTNVKYNQQEPIANKFCQTIGDGSATAFYVDHMFDTQDVVVSIRETASPYAQVYTDMEFIKDTVIIKFATAPAVNQYRVTIIG